jgi:hypothetical protein
LARRLARHGLFVSAGALAATLAHGAAAASAPPALMLATIKAASLHAAGQAAAGLVSAKVAALTQGVIQAMFLTKLKSIAMAVVALAVLGGVGSIGHRTLGDGLFAQEAGTLPGGPKQVQDGQAKLKQEIERLRAELARTQLELLQARQDLVVLKAEADLARAQADAARLKAKVDAAKAKTAPVPNPGSAFIPDEKRANDKKPEDNLLPGATKGVDPRTTASAVSPDGRTLVTGGDGVLVGHDAQTGQVRFKAIGHKGPISALAFSPDGRVLASGGHDKTVVLWDPPTGKQLRMILVPSAVVSVRFSEDGKTLVVVEIRDNERFGHEIDAATGREIRILREQLKDKGH